jgi:glycosyltransferase involved in cell wall biosynthesis
MKIAVIKKYMPMPAANIVNTLKHTQSFFNLGNSVEILAISQFVDFVWRCKVPNVYRFYDLNRNIKFKYFQGGIGFFLRHFSAGNNKLSTYFHYHNPFHSYLKFLRLFPKLYDFFDPEIRISKYCIKNRIDLAYCRDNFKTAIHNIINKIPTVIESHNVNLPSDVNNLIKLGKNRYFKGIITISDFIKQNYIKQGIPEEKILVEEDAVELKAFDKIFYDKVKIRKKLHLPIERKVILYAGKLRYDRGIDTIIEAANLLKKEKYSFFLLGGNKYRINKWEKYLVEKNINANIHILDFKPNSLIPYYLKAADILLATYSTNLESQNWMSPVKIFEYMASKTPIIATNLGRMNKICNSDECLFTIPDNPKDLAEKIKLLINNSKLQNRLVQNAYRKVKNYTYDKRCKKILDYFT